MKNIDFKSLIIGVLCTTIIFISIGASSQDKNLGDIEVRSISIINDNNDLITYIGNLDNQAGIILSHPENNDKLVFVANKDEVSIAIGRENTDGAINFPLYFGANGKNTMPLLEIKKEDATRLYVGPGQNESITTLELYGEADEAAIIISNRGLMQTNSNGDYVLLGGSSESGDGMLTIYDRNGEISWTN